MRQKRAGLALLATYVSSVLAANILTSRYGLIAIAPGLTATAGTAAIGGAIMVRDFLQDALGRAGVLLAIVLGAGLSYALSSHKIAAASGITFLIAEGLEFLVYTPLRKRAAWGTRKWAAVIAAANVTGAVADTLIFLQLAGFSVTWHSVAGQLAGKLYVTAAVVLAALGARHEILRKRNCR